MLRKTFDSKDKEITLSCIKSHKDEVDLYFSPNHVRMIKSRKMQGIWHAVCIGEKKKNKHKRFWQETTKKRNCLEVLDIDWILKYIRWKGVELMDLAQDTNRWWVL